MPSIGAVCRDHLMKMLITLDQHGIFRLYFIPYTSLYVMQNGNEGPPSIHPVNENVRNF